MPLMLRPVWIVIVPAIPALAVPVPKLTSPLVVPRLTPGDLYHHKYTNNSNKNKMTKN